jgi:hypothetical protein
VIWEWLSPVWQNALGGFFVTALIALYLKFQGANIALKATLSEENGINEYVALELIQGQRAYIIRLATDKESVSVEKYITLGESLNVSTWGANYTDGVVYYRQFALFGRVRSFSYGKELKAVSVSKERLASLKRQVKYYITCRNSSLALALELRKILNASKGLEGSYLMTYSLRDHYLHITFKGPSAEMQSPQQRLSRKSFRTIRKSRSLSSRYLVKLEWLPGSFVKHFTRSEIKYLPFKLFVGSVQDFKKYKKPWSLSKMQLIITQKESAIILSTKKDLRAVWSIDNGLKCLLFASEGLPLSSGGHLNIAITELRKVEFNQDGFLVRGTRTHLRATKKGQRENTVWLYFDKKAESLFALYVGGELKIAPMSKDAIKDLEDILSDQALSH